MTAPMLPGAPGFAVLGAGGTIGRALVQRLRAGGADVAALGRGDAWRDAIAGRHVIYAVGLTADFRTRALDTVEAHVGLLAEVLRAGGFASLLYLSSTRVYAGAPATAEETPLRIDPSDPSDLYNLSKLLGESLCLAQPSDGVRVARLANVVGGDDAASDNFVPALRREAAAGRIRLRSAPDSAKDYLHIDDAVDWLLAIAGHGRQRLYNVARGENVTHAQWLRALQARTGCSVEILAHAPCQRFMPIDVRRLQAEFPRVPRPVLDII